MLIKAGNPRQWTYFSSLRTIILHITISKILILIMWIIWWLPHYVLNLNLLPHWPFPHNLNPGVSLNFLYPIRSFLSMVLPGWLPQSSTLPICNKFCSFFLLIILKDISIIQISLLILNYYHCKSNLHNQVIFYTILVKCHNIWWYFISICPFLKQYFISDPQESDYGF